MVFASREQAAKQLASAVEQLGLTNLAIFALPRGGVVVGAEMSKQLKAPLGVVLVRKIGHPMSPEYAIGAVAEGQDPVYNPHEVATVDPRWLTRAEAEARETIAHRRQMYCGGNVITPISKDHTVILVDDGLATGLTMLAGAQALKSMGASNLIIAAPVASPESIEALHKVADKILVLDSPENFKGTISAHYQRFEQVDDKEVKQLLAQSFANLCQPVK